MHSVIALEDWSTKNVVGLVDANKQKHAHAAILVIACIKDILIPSNLNPFVLEHEVKVWEIAVALGKDKAIYEFIVVVPNKSEDLCNEVIEVIG